MIDTAESSSTRPYLIRALYEWCTDNGLTPYVAVLVDESVQVPMEYVKDGEIVLNISFDATSALKLGNDFIEFRARFAGTAREIMVPVGRVIAIYARENGQGMAFPVAVPTSMHRNVGVPPFLASEPQNEGQDEPEVKLMPVPESDTDRYDEPGEPPRPQSGSGTRPALKRVK